MNDLLRMATGEITRFLAAKLPSLGPDWWTKHVLNRLSFQQQRTARDRGFTTLQQLDFAALLRVLDQNWHELKDNIPSAYEARSWVKELQTVRNKWAHLSAEAMPASEVYRDADTLGRLLTILGADSASLDAVESLRAATVASMSRPASGNTASPSPAETSQPLNADTSSPTAPPMGQAKTLFQVGDLVALRSNPKTMLPVIEVITGGVENRYRSRLLYPGQRRLGHGVEAWEARLPILPETNSLQHPGNACVASAAPVPRNDGRWSSRRGGCRFARRMALSTARRPLPRVLERVPYPRGVVVRPDLSGFCPNSR